MDEYKRKNDEEVLQIKNILMSHIKDEQTQIYHLKDHIESVIAKTIESMVNGKIDKINYMLQEQNKASDAFAKRIDAHILRVEPYIEGFEGSKTIGKIIMWIGGIIITIGGSVAVLKGLYK